MQMEVKTYEEVLKETGFLYWKTVGVSMRPLIREGRDTVLIKNRPEGRCKKYDTVLFVRPRIEGRGRYVLHRILKVNPDGTYWIVGDNCIGGETVWEENILGVLVKVNRQGKMIDVTDFKYRAYVHLWCAPYHLRFFALKCRILFYKVAVPVARKLGIRRRKK